MLANAVAARHADTAGVAECQSNAARVRTTCIRGDVAASRLMLLRCSCAPAGGVACRRFRLCCFRGGLSGAATAAAAALVVLWLWREAMSRAELSATTLRLLLWPRAASTLTPLWQLATLNALGSPAQRGAGTTAFTAARVRRRNGAVAV